MALLTWTDDLSVKISKIDTQHKKLVDLINRLHEAMKQRKTNEVLGEIIEELVNYAIEHFRTEEEYFDQFGYLKATEHKMKHKDFVNKIAAFKSDFDSKKMMLSMEIMDFLKDWLVNHIKKRDKSYSNFLIEKGLS